MIPELGHFALVLALLLAGHRPFFGLCGAHRGDQRWMAVVRPAVAGQFVLVSSAVGVLDPRLREFRLLGAVRRQQFQFRAAHVLPRGRTVGRARRVAAAVGLDPRGVDAGGGDVQPQPAGDFRSRVMGVLGFVSLRLPAVHAATSNPFERLLPAPADGRDLNPVLQDPALAIHPPLLYMGYVGFAVAFAFACAAMLEGKLDQTWARWTRPWTTLAWCFLSVGIALGSWWAYYELGWGGYWFWDPVENASFMPWLVGTALIHSLAVTEKRGLFKSWTLLLAILAFSLSLLGTFLVRSGVLVSVHSFAADPDARHVHPGVPDHHDRRRARRCTPGARRCSGPRPDSTATAREAFLLYNNIVLVVAAAGGVRRHAGAADQRCAAACRADFGGPGRISQARFPYPGAAAGGAGVRRHPRRLEARTARHAVGGACVSGARRRAARRPGAGARRSMAPATGCPSSASCSACWIIVSSLFDPIDRLRRKLSLSRAIIGMTIAHIGLGVCVIAISTVESYTVERDVALAPGETVALGRYAYRFDKHRADRGT